MGRRLRTSRKFTVERLLWTDKQKMLQDPILPTTPQAHSNVTGGL